MSGHPNATAGAGEAESALAGLNAVMDRLTETVEEETARTRAGRLRAAAELDERKRDLAGQFAAESERFKNVRHVIAQSRPEALEALRRRHEALQSLLQTNLTVLATAHAVAEGIIRGVSGELARKHTPSTYAPSGRTNPPNAKASLPLALSRTL